MSFQVDDTANCAEILIRFNPTSEYERIGIYGRNVSAAHICSYIAIY